METYWRLFDAGAARMQPPGLLGILGRVSYLRRSIVNDPRTKAQATYDAAADSYDDPANEYWNRYGRRTIERLCLAPGSRVLDLACGAGASALPAAEQVGPTGRVIAVDLSANLLAIAKRKAKTQDLNNIQFFNRDMASISRTGDFDAIVCVFGVFFVESMQDFVSGLWGALRPGGSLAITTWGPDLFEPMYSAFDTAVRLKRPDLVSDFRPWDRLTSIASVEQLFRDVGATTIDVTAEEGQQPLSEAESWWKVVLGSGLRSVVVEMGPSLAEEVRSSNLMYAQENKIRSIATNVIYGRAIKNEP